MELLFWHTGSFHHAVQNTLRRPTDKSNNLTSGQQNSQGHYQQQNLNRKTNSPNKVFTNPNHPDSASLRDPQKVNQWRHHLCNGPWFGCYETAKRLRKQMESGHIVVERHAQPVTLGNVRARSVMERIRQKLTGTERDQMMSVSAQVDFLIREATSNQNLCQMYIGW
ncbi:unnamed protein product [Schistosoma mattheei]|uniref:Uncharacterized protein n=1 Tax=Schistosoma mattheei TaxID=31246 RepID=A0A183P7D9_9TREM|nr:unnamed protein product [Schistosoma mattheei]